MLQTYAVLFALGGLMGNIFHDYADVLVPLFVASRRYAGEVQFLVANLGERPAWPGKYGTLLRGLSKYDVVDLDAADAHVRCFRRLTVGLHMRKEFTFVPEVEAAHHGRLHPVPARSRATWRSTWRGSPARGRG
ncbi:hypothetical protein PR202_ga23678 [Eleusine coracana subsp. coracana]|uniref:Uncharacterized protein n=1 Tax=Eleusine coracana subsp. coracana TaxID=191504 RepID=A0AAV5D7H4_ELECO|nr:hypothetical protein PR202_ga23678 [Eleusine coracana subsp. coracana]